MAMRVWDVGKSKGCAVTAQIQVLMLPDAKASPRPTGLSLQDNLRNLHYEGMQMTTMTSSLIGAPSASWTWETIHWKPVEKLVRRLQMRIAKAIREKRRGKAKALQRLLTHSFYAKLLAVKRVSQNRGSKTAGIDGVTWRTSQQKIQAVMSLKQHSYKTKPLKRIYIPKKNKCLRPLSIPVMKCRAMQALYLLALEPIVETIADKNAYAFRVKRSAADAIEHCFKCLSQRFSAKFVFEGDIKSCFDNISHPWLRENIIMDQQVLNKWLTAGYLENDFLHPITEGVPQGGIISPALLNATMAGLENQVKAAVKLKDKVHICIYADDFIITGSTKEVLEEKVKPIVETFLQERGLSLSLEKTKITTIEDGFDFLGFNIRKYKKKLLIKPTKGNVKSFLEKIQGIIKRNKAARTENLIRQLNPIIRGWVNYFRYAVSKETFAYADHKICQMLLRWINRRHPNKSKGWTYRKYFRSEKLRNWIFTARARNKQGKAITLDLFEIGRVRIKRHIKIRAKATPYDPAFKDYFDKREGYKGKERA